MTTLYVDNIAPNLQSKISAPNLTLPTGSVLNVRNLITTSYLTTTSTTPVQAGINLSITPTSSSSKVLVNIFLNGVNRSTGEPRLALYRNGTFLTDLGSSVGQHASTNESGGRSYSYEDSPNTTSTATYQIWFSTSSGIIRINDYPNSSTRERSGMTLMEIAG